MLAHETQDLARFLRKSGGGIEQALLVTERWIERAARQALIVGERERRIAGRVTCESLIGHSRIRLRVREIGEQVHEHEHHAEEEHRALDRRKVAPRDRVDDVAAEARPAEDRLGEDAAGEVVRRSRARAR